MKKIWIKIYIISLELLFGSSLFLNLSADICQNALIRMNVFSRLENVQESLSQADIKEIKNLFESSEFAVREKIIDFLSKRNEFWALSLLVDRLKTDKDAKIRLLAAKAIEKMNDEFAIDELEIAFNDVDPVVQQFAKDAVKRGLTKVLENVAENMGFKEVSQWYDISAYALREELSEAELALFEGSVSKMIMELVPAPEGGWKPWLFYEGVPKGFWDIEENQKKYMKWLGEKLGFSKPEDWYGLTGEMIRANSGGGLLQHKFRGSPAQMIDALVEAPEGGWAPWLFKKLPNGFWDIAENQKAYVKWLGEKLKFTKPDDWYQLTQNVIQENSGTGLLQQKFRGSPSEMVKALVEAPEGGWLPWLLRGVPRGFWDDEANQKAYMKWLGEKLGYTKPEDWYLLTTKMIQENSGNGLLQKFNGAVSEMVMTLEEAPEDGWKKENFFSDLSKMEGRMRNILSRWFKGLSEPSFDDEKTHGFKFEESGVGIEADVLFEELKFAIEYHGGQHYKPVKGWGGQAVFEMIQKQDQETREAFKNAGYIYIEIPHFKWAGGSEAALKNLILEQLQEYEASSDAEVKARAARIREILSR